MRKRSVTYSRDQIRFSVIVDMGCIRSIGDMLYVLRFR